MRSSEGNIAVSNVVVAVGSITRSPRPVASPGALMTSVTGPLGTCLTTKRPWRSATTRMSVADRKGRFVLRHVHIGPVTLVISAPGYGTERSERVIDPTATTTFETAMFPSLDRIGSARVELLGEAQRRALDQQRAALNITNVVAADALGRFPDGNAAEALQRLPGTTIRLTRREGYDVIIRGA